MQGTWAKGRSGDDWAAGQGGTINPDQPRARLEKRSVPLPIAPNSAAGIRERLDPRPSVRAGPTARGAGCGQVDRGRAVARGGAKAGVRFVRGRVRQAQMKDGPHHLSPSYGGRWFHAVP